MALIELHRRRAGLHADRWFRVAEDLARAALPERRLWSATAVFAHHEAVRGVADTVAAVHVFVDLSVFGVALDAMIVNGHALPAAGDATTFLATTVCENKAINAHPHALAGHLVPFLSVWARYTLLATRVPARAFWICLETSRTMVLVPGRCVFGHVCTGLTATTECMSLGTFWHAFLSDWIPEHTTVELLVAGATCEAEIVPDRPIRTCLGTAHAFHVVPDDLLRVICLGNTTDAGLVVVGNREPNWTDADAFLSVPVRCAAVGI